MFPRTTISGFSSPSLPVGRTPRQPPYCFYVILLFSYDVTATAEKSSVLCIINLYPIQKRVFMRLTFYADKFFFNLTVNTF